MGLGLATPALIGSGLGATVDNRLQQVEHTLSCRMKPGRLYPDEVGRLHLLLELIRSCDYNELPPADMP